MQKKFDEDMVENPTIDDAKLEHLSSQHRNRLRDIIHKFQSTWDGTLGEINTTEHNIDIITGKKTFFSHPYRTGPNRAQLFTRKSILCYDWGKYKRPNRLGLHILGFARKKDGTLMFCVDHRGLNSVKIRNTYLIPTMYEFIDSL